MQTNQSQSSAQPTSSVAGATAIKPSQIRPTGVPDTAQFEVFVGELNRRFAERTSVEPLFLTDVGDLSEIYLQTMPEANRAYHTCTACRRFMQTYGSLVTIDANGDVQPAYWDAEAAPVYYRPVIEAMATAVRKAKVVGVFLSSEKVWGTPVTGEWRHYAIVPSERQIFKHALKTAGQAAAEKLEEYGMLCRSLDDYSEALTKQAVTLLKNQLLSRSEKVLAPAAWFLDLQTTLLPAKGKRRTNLIWRSVATAPTGFCHVRTTMLGTLLDDLKTGADFDDVARRFNERMAPLAYQRPQAAPTKGAIARAEKIVEQMGLAPALFRRRARLDEIQTYWQPKAPKPQETAPGGVFGHLKPKAPEPIVGAKDAPPTLMTWEKFAKTVLPDAQTIEVNLGTSPGAGMRIAGLVTAVNFDAPPILQWDMPEKRNPVAWYHYATPVQGGFRLRERSARDWSLEPSWVKVVGIAERPCHWNGNVASNFPAGAFLLLEGAKDQTEVASCLFPEILKSELREVRAVIEAHSNATKIEPSDDGAYALVINGNTTAGGLASTTYLRVTTNLGVSLYKIDRWD